MGITTCAAASSTSAQVQPPRKRRQQGTSSSLLQLARSRLPAPSRDEAAAGGIRTPLGCTFGWIFGCTLGFLALGAAAGAVAAGAAAAGAIGPKVPPTS